MKRQIAILSLVALLPLSAFASTIASGRTLVLSESPTDNAYLTGTDITVVAPLPGDLLVAGGTITVNAPVAGDVILTGGRINVQKPVTGDARVAGGEVLINAPVGGDLIAFGGSVIASTSAKDTRIAGGTVSLTGAGGPVVIYGADITLGGDFAGDVTIEASDRITLVEGTHIRGALRYNAPHQIALPPGVTVDGGVSYIGSSSFLPSTEEAQTFAIAGATILFIVHLLALLILAGLFAGLFPTFTARVADRAIADHSPRRFVLLSLLGFGILVATPVLILILMLSFVGIGVAILLAVAYALLLILSYVYAGILAGAALARGLMKRYVITWREAVLGMIVLYFIGIIPVLGALVKFILMIAAGGAIVSLFYSYALRRTQEETIE